MYLFIIVFPPFSEIEHEDLHFPILAEHSCQGRCGHSAAPIKCHCDQQCVSFKDCCVDYDITCVNKPVKNDWNSSLQFTCFTIKLWPTDDPASVWLVGTCARDWRSESIRKLCELNSDQLTELEYFKAFLTRWPVFDKRENNFKNIFCALCNDNSFINIEPWNVTFLPVTQGYKELNTLVNLHECTSLAQNKLSLGRVGKRLRFCESQMVSHCPLAENNTLILSACPAYSAQICSSQDHTVYKNPHCAVCNGLNISARELSPLSCPTFGFQFAWAKTLYLKNVWNFAVGVSWEVSNSNSNQCSETYQIYDPYSRMCRNVTSLSDILLAQTESLYLQNITENIDDICCQSQKSWILFGLITPSISYFQDEAIPCFLSLLNISSKAVETHWQSTRYIGDFFSNMMLKSDDKICSLAHDLHYVVTKLNRELEVCGIDNLQYIYMGDKFIVDDEQNKCNGNWYNGTAKDFVRNEANLRDIFIHEDKLIVPQKVYHVISYRHEESGPSFIEEHVDVCGEEATLPTCRMVILYPHEYDLIQSIGKPAKLSIGKLSLKYSDYFQLNDGRLLICAKNLLQSKTALFSYSGYLDTVNLIGTCTSYIAIAIIFLLYCIFTELRNFHLKCIVSVAGALFFALLLPMISTKVSLSHRVCVAFAMFSHFAWLATFMWMAIIGGNLFHLFVFRPLQTPEDREASLIFRFGLPIIGWGLPFIIVTTCIFFHLLKAETFLFEYGVDAPCWISDSTANLAAFGVPVAICQGINLVLFFAIIVASCRNQNRSRHMQRNLDEGFKLQDVVLCLKVTNNDK